MSWVKGYGKLAKNGVDCSDLVINGGLEIFWGRIQFKFIF